MTLLYEYERDLTILKMYLHSNNKLPRSWCAKVRALQTGTQTDRQTNKCHRTHYHTRNSRVYKIYRSPHKAKRSITFRPNLVDDVVELIPELVDWVFAGKTRRSFVAICDVDNVVFSRLIRTSVVWCRHSRRRVAVINCLSLSVFVICSWVELLCCARDWLSASTARSGKFYVGSIKRCYNPSICLSVCLSHVPMAKRCVLGTWLP